MAAEMTAAAITSRTAAVAAALAIVTAIACQRDDDPPPSRPPRGKRPTVVHAEPAVSVAPQVEDALRQAKNDGYDLLVYASADWCEPCKQFEQALGAGELDQLLADVRLLEYDFDRDRTRLAAAGYTTELIPLYVVPDAHGRATSRRMEGSIKADDAVSRNLEPRLRRLLGR